MTKTPRVLIYGHFSVVHPGHQRYISFAKSLGGSVVVALIGDAAQEGVGIPTQAVRQSNLKNFLPDASFVNLYSTELDQAVREIKPQYLVLGVEYLSSIDDDIHRAISLVYTQGGKVLYHNGDHGSIIDDRIYYTQISTLCNTRLAKLKQITDKHCVKLSEIDRTLNAFTDLNILVVGDVIVDEYVNCEPLGISAEAPVIVVKENKSVRFLGGSGVVASHLRALGASVTLVSLVGNDETAEFVRSSLDSQGILSQFICDETRQTTFKRRYMSDHHKLFRVSRLDDHSITPIQEKQILDTIEESFANYSAVILSDFSYGLLTSTLVESLKALCDSSSIPIYGDSQASSQQGSLHHFSNFTAIFPNEKEARLALEQSRRSLEQLGRLLFKSLAPKELVLKVSSDGFLLYPQNDGSAAIHFPALNPFPVDTAGAGDALLSAYSLSRLAGADPVVAGTISTFMAQLATEQLGNLPITKSCLRERIMQLYSFDQ